TGLAVLIVHHHRKSPGANGDRIRGSNALLGSVDVSLELERLHQPQAEDKPRRLLRGEGRFTAIPDELLIELTDTGYRSLGSDIRQVKQDHDAQLIHHRINEENGPTVADIVADTELSDSRVRKLLKSLDSELQTTKAKGRGGAERYWPRTLLFSSDPREEE